MSVRPPQSLRQFHSTDSGFNVLEYELMSERAQLPWTSRPEGRVRPCGATGMGCGPPQRRADRENLVDRASNAVWIFFIQREICGLRNGPDVIQRYAIPNEVLARVGAVRR